ncbi:HlyD family efflux transporter periplasmic adaptor subunit [Ferrovibrio sp.]|jgi:multidrug resistance efflux pump|uniref:HlyD family efflux transporter periplasmic adaptor subunit n=1 Tax=Ferrovibrio sp. TaxID=1917215 RepID=UPI0035B42273
MYLSTITATKTNLGRLLRIALGLFLLAVFGYALLPGVFYAQYPLGRVNAELVTMRAPIEGQIEFSGVRTGEMVRYGQTLAVLRDPPGHDVRLADLQAISASLAERTAVLDRQIAALEPIMQRLHEDSQDFHRAVNNNLSAQIAETESRIRGAEANLRLLEAELRRVQPLASADYASRAELDRRRAEAEIGQAELATLRNTLQRLTFEREAAGRGIYLSDSYNNAPYSQQRRDDIELQRLTLQSRRAELEVERLQTLQQIETEQRRRTVVDEATITATVDGILWRRLESDGAMIGTSAPLLQIADCSHIFFEVPRDRRSDETLSIGDATQVEFEQNDRMTTYPARLVGVRGEQDAGNREFAVSMPLAAGQLSWIFSVDFSDNDEGMACPIGRIGRLRHSDTMLDRLTRRATTLFDR